VTWLVTGGAGYIGAHVVRALLAADISVVVLDDFSTGVRSFVPDGVPVVEGGVTEPAAVARALEGVAGVVHLAGFKYAGVSVERPLHTYEQNVGGMLALLRGMRDAGVDRIVYSSSAAVYGTPGDEQVTESAPTRPESPYGESKLVGEWLLRNEARARQGGRPLRHVSLRYFNVVGSGHPDIWDSSPHNLMPLVLTALREGRTPRIHGDDYPTPDGTCVRDYVHVADVAAAHVAAARALDEGRPLEPVYNLGSGDGTSVREIMNAAARVTGIAFEPEIGPRRPGDAARIVASGALAARDLGWRNAHSVEEMVASAWAAQPR